jgi:hypothetical protein
MLCYNITYLIDLNACSIPFQPERPAMATAEPRRQAHFSTSPLIAGAAQRLVLAGVLTVSLWLAVAWAMDWLG